MGLNKQNKFRNRILRILCHVQKTLLWLIEYKVERKKNFFLKNKDTKDIHYGPRLLTGQIQLGTYNLGEKTLCLV